MNVDELFDSFKKIKVGVLGDVMLDTYWWGKTERISPEAPVPIVSVSKNEYRIGGAGNVALNLASLRVNKVSLISVYGMDQEAGHLQNLLEEKGIDTSYCIRSAERVTTNKIRIISRNQQMMRLDAEMTTPLLQKDEEALLKNLEEFLVSEKPSIIILEDYNKGVLTEKVIAESIALCKKHRVLTAVDPKRLNFFAFKEVDIFKPNLKEALEALNIVGKSLSESLLHEIHAALKNKLQHRASFITLSENGVFFENEKESGWIPTHVRSIADVSGAGDTVISVASLVFAATGNYKLMAEIANIAGGLVCEEVGTVAINKERLRAECKLLLKTN
jgi:rfaE bifunctional protein kinase chain/domain